MLGPYIKSRGTRGTKMSANADLITVETYVQQGETFMGQNVKKNYILGALRGSSDWAYLAFQLSSHPYLCTCEIRKQSDKKFLSLNPKYEKKLNFFHIWGVLGGGGALPR